MNDCSLIIFNSLSIDILSVCFYLNLLKLLIIFVDFWEA